MAKPVAAAGSVRLPRREAMTPPGPGPDIDPGRWRIWLRYGVYAAVAVALVLVGHLLQEALAHPASAPSGSTPPACALEGFCALHALHAIHTTRTSAPPATDTPAAAAKPNTAAAHDAAHYHEETVAQIIGKAAGAAIRSRA